MRVIRLQAENLKRIQAVDITPDQHLALITGVNEAGKSSVLDSLWWALAGSRHIQSVPIRHGENKARIKLDLGELVVERRFTASSSYLHVENADGSPYASPQMVLDKLLGALTFDPLAFTRMKPADQFEELRKAVNLTVDFAALDKATADEFAQRTEFNRQAKDRAAQARGIQIPEGLPDEPVNTEALLDIIQKGDTTNASIVAEQGRRVDRRSLAQRLFSDAERLTLDTKSCEEKILALQQRIEANKAAHMKTIVAAQDIDDELKGLPPLADHVDTTDIRKQLRDAQTTNQWIEQRSRSQKMLAEAADLQVKADALTASMEARAKSRADSIAAAKMPVDGLSLGDKCVVYQGLPFDQASLAVQIKVSLAIAMAAKTPLRVVRIREGSALDSKSMEMIRQLAIEHDFQVWVEAMREDGKTGIVISEGQVVSTPETRAAAEQPSNSTD